MPALAQRIVDIDLQGVWSTTLQGAPFVLHQDARMILFATDRNLEVSVKFPATTLVRGGPCPEDIRMSANINTFKAKLKTHYFKVAFNYHF